MHNLIHCLEQSDAQVFYFSDLLYWRAKNPLIILPISLMIYLVCILQRSTFPSLDWESMGKRSNREPRLYSYCTNGKCKASPTPMISMIEECVKPQLSAWVCCYSSWSIVTWRTKYPRYYNPTFFGGKRYKDIRYEKCLEMLRGTGIYIQLCDQMNRTRNLKHRMAQL